MLSKNGQRYRLRSFQAVVGPGERQIQVGLRILPPDLAEELLDTARVVVGPALVVEIVAGEKVVETSLAPPNSNSAVFRPNEPPDASTAPPGYWLPLFV